MTVKRYIITADDVVDNLTSTDTTVPLSAKQGNVLAGRATSLESRATTLEGKTANATTSSKGIVQVGSGLSVTDGVISVSGGSIPSVIAPASVTFDQTLIQAGTVSIVPSDTTTHSHGGVTSWTTLASNISVTEQSSLLSTVPKFIQIPSIPSLIGLGMAQFNFTYFIQAGSQTGSSGGGRVLRASDSSVLGETGNMYASAGGNATKTITITLPTDWNPSTDRLTLQGWLSNSVSASWTKRANLTQTITNKAVYL